ncbi:MAG: hypothetical protein K8R54_03625 [Bacteroidales bacterium]|nr:hypothetical protein [Bacteroidales bacterium]
MKRFKKLFYILLIPFLFYSTAATGQVKKKSSDKEVLSVKISKVKKAEIGEELMILYPTKAEINELFLFIDNSKVDKLEKVYKNFHLYKFKLNKIDEDEDTVSNYINPKNRSQVSVDLFIGTSNKNKELIHKNFKLVFDEKKLMREWWSGITIIILMFFIIFIINKNRRSILRDNVNNKENPPYSLSRTQMAFWTIIVLFAYFVIWCNTGVQIEITPQVLALLGISAGTTIGGIMIDRNDSNNPKIPERHQEMNKSENFFMNILSDSKGLSIHRFQNVVFTIAVASYFMFEVWHNNKIPHLDENLIVLMGISSVTYLAIKKDENKINKKQPVG